MKALYSNSEQVLKRHICEVLSRQPQTLVVMYPSFRGAKRADGSFVKYTSRFMPPGFPDLIIWFRTFSKLIEVKRPGAAQRNFAFVPKGQGAGKLSENQIEFARVFEQKTGGRVAVVRSVEEALDVWRKFRDECLAMGGGAWGARTASD